MGDSVTERYKIKADLFSSVLSACSCSNWVPAFSRLGVAFRRRRVRSRLLGTMELVSFPSGRSVLLHG